MRRQRAHYDVIVMRVPDNVELEMNSMLKLSIINNTSSLKMISLAIAVYTIMSIWVCKQIVRVNIVHVWIQIQVHVNKISTGKCYYISIVCFYLLKQWLRELT